MYSSFFSYNVQKPYPFKWFTPVVLVGGLILAVLLSVMNFVQNSYALVVEYVDNPNVTVAQGAWFQDWPSYLTNGVRPTCQPTNLPVNTQFFTNQSGLMWTITSFFTEVESPQALPSLPYLNNILEDCDVTKLRIGYDSTQDVDVSVLQYLNWNLEIRAFVTCRVSGPSGGTFVNATALYNALTPYAMPGVDDFVAKNATGRASMFWSATLLRAYWIIANNRVSTVGNIMFQDNNIELTKGVVTLFPNKSVDDMTSLRFFNLQYDFLEKARGFGITGELHPAAFYINLKDNNTAGPHIWNSVNLLSQAMFSAVLADLGQSQVAGQHSLVTDASTLQQLTSDFNNTFKYNTPIGTPPPLVNESYTSQRNGRSPAGALGPSPSVVATKYLCQIPQLKPVGDIFVSVLLADLVFLQFAWKLYTLLVDKLLLQKQPDATACQACTDTDDSVMTKSGEHDLQDHVRYYIKDIRPSNQFVAARRR